MSKITIKRIIFISSFFILALSLLLYGIFATKCKRVDCDGRVKDFIESKGGKAVADKAKTSVGQVFLDNRYITDEDIEMLCIEYAADIQKVWHLRLNNARITNKALDRISNSFPNLFNLEIDWTDISDEGMVFLIDCKKLRVLSLKGTCVSDVSIDDLGKIAGLTSLDLSGTKISDNGVVQLKSHLPFPGTRIIKRDTSINRPDVSFPPCTCPGSLPELTETSTRTESGSNTQKRETKNIEDDFDDP